MVKPGFHMIVRIIRIVRIVPVVSKKMFRRSGRSYGNATQTIANDPDRFKLYMIVPIVRIELNSIQAIEVVSVVRGVCDRLGSVSI